MFMLRSLSLCYQRTLYLLKQPSCEPWVKEMHQHEIAVSNSFTCQSLFRTKFPSRFRSVCCYTPPSIVRCIIGRSLVQRGFPSPGRPVGIGCVRPSLGKDKPRGAGWDASSPTFMRPRTSPLVQVQRSLPRSVPPTHVPPRLPSSLWLGHPSSPTCQATVSSLFIEKKLPGCESPRVV